MQKMADGTVEYTVHDEPQKENTAKKPNPKNQDQVEKQKLKGNKKPVPKKPDQAFPDLEKPDLENREVTINTERLLSTDCLVSTDSSPKPPEGAEGKTNSSKRISADEKDRQLIAGCDLKTVPADLMQEFLQYRRAIKHPLQTPRGVQGAINILDGLGNTAAMRAALDNTMDNEYRKIVPAAAPVPSAPTDAMFDAAQVQGISRELVAGELQLMAAYYESKGRMVRDWDAAFVIWLENKIKFEQKRIKQAAAAPSEPTGAMQEEAGKYGLVNGAVAAEVKLMVAYHQSKGNPVQDWDAAFVNWMAHKQRFEERGVKLTQAGSSGGFSSWKDTSWMDEIDPAELGFNCTEEEWRNA
jgi:hypothetical protein